MSRSRRALRIEATNALIHDAIVPIAKKHDWELLEEIARIVQADAPVDLAVTDPAMYVTLRNAISRFHLKGWSRMTPERVRAVAERANAPLVSQAV